jgi:hypothetical protein
MIGKRNNSTNKLRILVMKIAKRRVERKRERRGEERMS